MTNKKRSYFDLAQAALTRLADPTTDLDQKEFACLSLLQQIDKLVFLAPGHRYLTLPTLLLAEAAAGICPRGHAIIGETGHRLLRWTLPKTDERHFCATILLNCAFALRDNDIVASMAHARAVRLYPGTREQQRLATLLLRENLTRFDDNPSLEREARLSATIRASGVFDQSQVLPTPSARRLRAQLKARQAQRGETSRRVPTRDEVGPFLNRIGLFLGQEGRAPAPQTR